MKAPGVGLSAQTKSEALRLYKLNPDIDLMIVDLDINPGDDKGKLRGMLGIEFLREVRSGNSEIHLIAYSVFDTTSIRDILSGLNVEFVKKYAWGVENSLLKLKIAIALKIEKSPKDG